MAKTDALRRFLLPCFFPANTNPAPPASKKRISTSLRDDLDEPTTNRDQDSNSDSQTTPSRNLQPTALAPPRPSKSMVIGTFFGHRRAHVWFCVQHDRLSSRPSLLLDLPISTHSLVNEMRCGLVRIALESSHDELGSCQLRSIPVWTMYCNGRKLGFAVRKKAGDRVRSMLKTMRSTTVGAGVIPFGSEPSGTNEEVMYMRANYEHVIGSADSESFHLINPDNCPGQELTIFLLRSTNGASS